MRQSRGAARHGGNHVCRLFGLSSAPLRTRATFWLLDAPDSLSRQSHRDPDGTGEAQRVHHRAADQHGARPERQRLEDVGAAPDAAVEQQRDTVAHGSGDGRQRLYARRQRIQRAAAMV